MTIALHVRWPNAGSPLLDGAIVSVVADGADVAATSQAPGDHRFEIPDGAARVQLSVAFVPTLAVSTGAQPFVVLTADQAYVVVGTTLVPDPLPFRLENGEIVSQNVNPLIDTVGASNAAAGLTIAEVRTEFVDLSAMWRAHGDQRYLGVFDAETEVETTLVAIGATGSTPPLWFASFPRGLQPPTPEVGALVFYRPALQHGYKQPAGVDPFETATALSRYLLTPRDSRQPMIVDGTPQAREADTFFFEAGPIYLRASFQRAVANSGKPVVMFHPWPQGGTNFGDAATAKLPTLLNGMLRLLRGIGQIPTGFPLLTLGRLGLSGYSAGGPATFAALRANASRVRELYLFDPMFLATAADAVIHWATHTPGFRLRMTGEVAFGSMHAIARTVRQRVSGEAGDLQLTAHPDTRARWGPTAKGGWQWWNYTVGFKAARLSDFHSHHQFLLYGGQEFDVAPDGTVLRYVPWLEEFLGGSGY